MADNLPPSSAYVTESGSLNFPECSGPHWPVSERNHSKLNLRLRLEKVVNSYGILDFFGVEVMDSFLQICFSCIIFTSCTTPRIIPYLPICHYSKLCKCTKNIKCTGGSKVHWNFFKCLSKA
jgi:hypothetical protein